jgi:hypothetical protein
VCVCIFINAYIYIYAEAAKPLDTAAMKALYIYIRILYILYYILYITTNLCIYIRTN